MKTQKKEKPFKVSKESVYATGKRKTSVARVWINRGTGKVVVNGMDLDIYFNKHFSVDLENGASMFKSKALEAVELTDMSSKFDVICSVKGGGTTGQIDAIRHGIAKCIRAFDEDKKSVLRSAGLLTRDARVVERKKCGKKKARKSPQFSKR